MSDQLLGLIIGNTFDVGIMVGETGNKNHAKYLKKREAFRNEVIHTMKKEIMTTIKLEGSHAVSGRERIKECV